MSPDPVNAILIVRLSALGDVVMASPLVRALRARYPDARIAWLVQPEAASLLEAHPELDEVIVWPRGDWHALARRGRWRALAREVRAFARRLRAARFDLVLDLQGLAKSGALARLTRAPRRVGLGSREGSRWLMTEVVDAPPDDPRMGSEYRRLAEALGLDPADFDMAVGLEEADRAFADELIARHGLAAGYAALCPFTTRPQKHWREERWRELAGRLHAQTGLPSVMLGGPGDHEAAAAIRAGAGDGLVDATGATSLREAAALIARARLVVGVDTGLMHMGIAFGVPTVALFGSTRPYLDTGRDDTAVLHKDLWCSPCRRRPICGGAYSCMRLIEVDEVLAAASRLLGKP